MKAGQERAPADPTARGISRWVPVPSPDDSGCPVPPTAGAIRRLRCVPFTVTSLRSLAIPDLVADPDRVKRLIAEGETLFVERKERDPKGGLGQTVASFANMIGGWLLIGVDDDGQIVGYEPPGRVDLQHYIRDLLRTQVDPLPPFAAVTILVGDATIGVVRVAESTDQPHITSDGVIYVRNDGGKQRVKDHRDILQMARRGSEARAEAAD